MRKRLSSYPNYAEEDAGGYILQLNSSRSRPTDERGPTDGRMRPRVAECWNDVSPEPSRASCIVPPHPLSVHRPDIHPLKPILPFFCSDYNTHTASLPHLGANVLTCAHAPHVQKSLLVATLGGCKAQLETLSIEGHQARIVDCGDCTLQNCTARKEDDP